MVSTALIHNLEISLSDLLASENINHNMCKKQKYTSPVIHSIIPVHWIVNTNQTQLANYK